MKGVTVIGAGLAGSEAAWFLAQRGYPVTLVEQKPIKKSPAHTNNDFAELVCSNSLKAIRTESAAGLLKAEMRLLGSLCLEAADRCSVPAGGALAVDREGFSAYITQALRGHTNIETVCREAGGIDTDHVTIIASGPMTEGGLAKTLGEMCRGFLSFYDAAAPIVTADSIDMEKVHAAARYGRGGDDYLNCYFDKEGYADFWTELSNARIARLHEFDTGLYEGCMPIEKLASRGMDTMRFGPLKPVGLQDPATGRRPWAAVQLRRENRDGTMYNLVGFQTNLAFSEQERVFRKIPGLARANFVRYGVMHRNSFIDSPRVLAPDFHLKEYPAVFVAGQLTGTEGYMESAACGMMVARFAAAKLENKEFRMPGAETMCGALMRYITTPNTHFQPMGSNMGLLPPLEEPIRDKQQRNAALSARALKRMEEYADENRY